MEDQLDQKAKSFEKHMVFIFTFTDGDIYYIEECIRHIHSL